MRAFLSISGKEKSLDIIIEVKTFKGMSHQDSKELMK